MFVDLCIDVFEENREKTWTGIFENLNKDSYWVARSPPKVVEPVKEEPPAPAKKAAPPRRKPKPKKTPKVVNKRAELYDDRPLEEKLWFS